MMKPQREQLETLAAVIDAGTFDAAARMLGVTPSAVSQRIKTFEQELGRVLVVREKPIRATESGEPLVRLARQLALLEHDAGAQLGLGASTSFAIPVAVNADSMATWLLPAFARVAAQRAIVVDLHLDNQEHTAALLASGAVMAAVTAQAQPVPGCTTTPLGGMTYQPVATPDFAERWFPAGPDAASLALAPYVDFDRKDELQSRYLRSRAGEASPPRHYVPASADFALAVMLGLGWGMLPDAQAAAEVADGRLVALDPGAAVTVQLYWQQWNLRSELLDAVAAAVLAEARRALAG
jgi:LysR family transcriptional regulator (chromosome initiation inhibitor)